MLRPIGGVIISITDRIPVRGNAEPDPSLGDIPSDMLRANIHRQREMLEIMSVVERDQDMRREYLARAEAELERRGVVL